MSLEKLNRYLVVLTTVLGLTFCSLVTMADPHKSQRGEDRGRPPGPEHLVKDLGISEDNREAFLKIMKDAHDKRREIHHMYRGSRDEERVAMDSLHEEMMGQLAGILTQEQLGEFEQFIVNHKPPPPPRRRH